MQLLTKMVLVKVTKFLLGVASLLALTGCNTLPERQAQDVGSAIPDQWKAGGGGPAARSVGNAFGDAHLRAWSITRLQIIMN